MVEKCAKCHKHIEGTIVTAMNKKWHSECFVCTGCHSPLAGQSFHNKDGSPYCIKCRQEKFDPTCDVSHYTTIYLILKPPLKFNAPLPYIYINFISQKCGKKIDPTVKYTIYQDKSFHRECFTCSECNQPIEGKKFVIKDGKYCCADHLK
ncbi:unnamed protein product [Rodentolepis nana]|uniref:LIM zinc-binding domain-containing protein n=1 Tax=Rodentolepis nana TaxID=102285 RepID=A0A0R3T8J9_RODNA|nr:unnamed protein product [Rodentolepis nana]